MTAATSTDNERAKGRERAKPMQKSGAKSLGALGFLTVVENEEQGLFGGYLLLDSGGRPLEFHCTAPVKSNRAQQILYGATLAPYLYGEQIGRTLVEKSKLHVAAVLTDLAPVLAVREHVDKPVALLLSREKSHVSGGSTVKFTVGPHEFAVLANFHHDRERLAAELATVAEQFDLSEPFDRIREAILEARRTAA